MKKLIYSFFIILPFSVFANIHVEEASVYSVDHKKEELLKFKNNEKETVVFFI
jgi:hypothetical protein